MSVNTVKLKKTGKQKAEIQSQMLHSINRDAII